jgi:hypothetical protein
VEHEPAPAAEAEPAPGPQLLSRGVYSLFRTPEGGMHLAFRPEGEEADRHIPLPPALMRMAETAANGGGGPMAMMKALMSHG